MELDQPFSDPSPDDPYAEFAHVVLLGFERDPDHEELYAGLEALGGVYSGSARTLARSVMRPRERNLDGKQGDR